MSNIFFTFSVLGILTGWTYIGDGAGKLWRFIFFIPLIFQIPRYLLYFLKLRIESPIFIYDSSENIKIDLKKHFMNFYDEENAELATDLYIEE